MPMYNFKKIFPLVLSTFIKQSIFFPVTYNAFSISEPDLTMLEVIFFSLPTFGYEFHVEIFLKMNVIPLVNKHHGNEGL